MTHIITSLCLRDGACVEVCPVECIVPGKPENEWPWFYIDPDTCIDCGACIPECPFEAIFTEEDVPTAYEFDGSKERMPHDTKVKETPPAGTVIDLTDDIQPNYDFYSVGPGYEALKM
jgi:ferredoxin